MNEVFAFWKSSFGNLMKNVNITVVFFIILICFSTIIKSASLKRISRDKNYMILRTSQVKIENTPKICKPKLIIEMFSQERKTSLISCDLLVRNSICIYDDKKIIQSPSVISNLALYYKFDELKIIDYSGNNNISKNLVTPSVGYGGIGSSALFVGGDYIKVQNNYKLNNLNSYSLSFWFYLIKDFYTLNKGNRYCPLFQKGKDDYIGKVFKRSPAIYLDREEKTINLRFTTSSISDPEGELIVSKTKINFSRWIHIGIIKSNNGVKLYMNGILDSEIILKGNEVENQGDIYIGGVKWLKQFCQFPFMIDEFKFYNKAISSDYFKAETSGVLSNLNSDNYKYGCNSCTLEEAIKSCDSDFRLCSLIELNSGGYQISRSLGWTNWKTLLWSYSASLDNKENFKNIKGFGLCCLKS